jgi:hypothetical protein
MFDAMTLLAANPEEAVSNEFGTYEKFAIEPSVLYEAALADMLATGLLTEADVELASKTRDTVHAVAAATGSDVDVVRRATILEQARHHFTNVALAQHGPGLGIHILRDLDWKH